MAFPFYCCTFIPSPQHSISLVNGRYHLSGCRDFCPGKAILQHIKHIASFLNARPEKRIKLFCRREWQDKQITRKWQSLPCIMTSSVQQLRCHPVSSDTQGMQVRCSWKRKAHIRMARGLWFHMPAVGVWIPTSKKHTKVAVFPQTKWLSCSGLLFFFFSPTINL